MKKYLLACISFILLFSLIPSLTKTATAVTIDKNKTCTVGTKKTKYFVNVPVTTLWTSPNQVRSIDKLIYEKNPDVSLWNRSLTVSQKLDTLGRIDTQALYGQEVKVIKRQKKWLKVAVTDQYSPKSKQGYIGWVPASHIISTKKNASKCTIVIVKEKVANLYASTKSKQKSMQISFNTILPVIGETNKWYVIQTPAGTKRYIKKAIVHKYRNYASIPKPTAKDLITTGKEFLGLPYLWGGISAYGFDCSGFVYSIYKQHGILIPRDSSVQAVNGKPVSLKNLKPGDLLFFANNNGKGKIHHVAMYIGKGQIIHSPNYNRSLEIRLLQTQPYQNELVSARRYLK
ncbi:NlpC/P60 family protein [Viridibacillus sp. NPDC096237]|uniref:C40 family peptidase n=1 Tax=Viridibacillus sp. NPDC096237 TaxID=3390721 RepID=UPI003D053A08